MSEDNICITTETLTKYGFTPKIMQINDSQTETSSQSESLTTTSTGYSQSETASQSKSLTTARIVKCGLPRLEVWINDNLGIILIQDGDGYLPKFWPPLQNGPYLPGNILNRQPSDNCGYHGKGLITTDHELRSLTEYVKNAR
ncbi:MAG: hypothetical protein HDS33_05425 [Bacteroides sp.]|nr:hypothetical protein [Bacteroides sp.]